MPHKQKECEMFHKFNQNQTLIRKYEREEKKYFIDKTIARPKILKQLYRISTNPNPLATPRKDPTPPKTPKVQTFV